MKKYNKPYLKTNIIEVSDVIAVSGEGLNDIITNVATSQIHTQEYDFNDLFED